MWNEKRSLVLSKVCTVLCMAGLLAALTGGPWLVRWLTEFSANAREGQIGLFLATLYSGGAAAAVLLVSLYRLLHNIGRGDVFTGQNVSLLRCISWCCFIGGGICLASALYYLPWGLVALAAGFVGLVVRVVKNVIAEAILLKEENDYTI